MDFPRIDRLPPYIFQQLDEAKAAYLESGGDLLDFGMGNPDLETPDHIVQALIESAKIGESHRYSASRGIHELRESICHWYQRRFDVELNPETETVVTIGSKEGLAHLALACMGPGDLALVPDPCYPIHAYAFIIAGSDIRLIPLHGDEEYLLALEHAIRDSWPRPKMMVLNFPSNPTGDCVDITFFERVVALAKRYSVWIIHDFAYADLGFDGYQPPSILQVPAAKDIAVESYSLSKRYNMPGWRVGFMSGNPTLVNNLMRLKSYMDYGMFAPIQAAAIAALNSPDSCVDKIRQRYQMRRDTLCSSLNTIGWCVDKPHAAMFVWAKIPEQFIEMGSFDFAQHLLQETGVAVSPGIGFGDYGDEHVRFSLVQNKLRIEEACARLAKLFK